MRTIICILFVIITVSNTAFAQDVLSADQVMKNRKVRSSTQFECDNKGKNCKPLYQHFYDRLGQLTKTINYSGNKPNSTNFYSYNKFGKLDTAHMQFSGQAKWVSQIYKYNSNGDVIEYYSCFEKIGCKLAEKYEYTANGLLKRRVEFRDGKVDTEVVYIYDKFGNNTQIVTKFISSGTILKESNFYNTNNELVKSVSFDPDGVELDSTKYEYDTEGRVLSLNWMGGLNYKNTYKYDRDGNEIEYKSFSLIDDELNDHRAMTYLHGLLVTRIHYANNKIHRYFKFEYELYDS